MSSGSAEDVGPDEAPGLLQQALLVDEGAADHAVLRVFPIADERADAVDHRLGLLGLQLSAREDPQALQQLLLPVAGVPPSLVEATLTFAGLEVPDVRDQQRQERGGAFAPARSRDVDLADAAHAIPGRG